MTVFLKFSVTTQPGDGGGGCFFGVKPQKHTPSPEMAGVRFLGVKPPKTHPHPPLPGKAE
jgi:hypothetical protein